jgi:hypothetical protein
VLDFRASKNALARREADVVSSVKAVKASANDMAYGDELSFILHDVRLVKVFGPLCYLGCPTIQDGQERACKKEVEPDISGVLFCDRCQKEVSPIPVAEISRGRFEDCDGNVIKITVFGENAGCLLKMTRSGIRRRSWTISARAPATRSVLVSSGRFSIYIRRPGWYHWISRCWSARVGSIAARRYGPCVPRRRRIPRSNVAPEKWCGCSMQGEVAGLDASRNLVRCGLCSPKIQQAMFGRAEVAGPVPRRKLARCGFHLWSLQHANFAALKVPGLF